jgi:hypothetical protein
VEILVAAATTAVEQIVATLTVAADAIIEVVVDNSTIFPRPNAGDFIFYS